MNSTLEGIGVTADHISHSSDREDIISKCSLTEKQALQCKESTVEEERASSETLFPETDFLGYKGEPSSILS